MRSYLSSIFVAAFLLTVSVVPALASPCAGAALQPTAYRTATPLEDGRILYVVQEGDTLWKISAITGVPIDELERLNNIRREDSLQVGTTLVLGIVTPTYAEPTLAFQPSATPSPLPVTGKGDICVSFFNDADGDGFQQEEGEGLVAGGQVSVALIDGTEVGNHTIDDATEEYCFVDIPAGEYNVAAAAPKNYNPTAAMNQFLTLEPGAKAFISFAVQGDNPQSGTGDGQGGGGGSWWVGLIGLALLGGAGFMIYTIMRPRRSLRW
ncbi:MAG: LysM peptidoglycan-binding domain-containing protein [Anaerolineales bacterium]|nr:LysM peptidoglycan-binding domain-containing protein [Anaerolineales bacterium]